MKEKLMREKSIYSAAVPVFIKTDVGKAKTEYIEITKGREKENGRKKTETVSYLKDQILISETVL